MPGVLRCGKCQSVIPPDLINVDQVAACPRCSRDLLAYAFPALVRNGVNPGPVAAEVSDATCFYHPENRADVPCASCGRFLCSVCEVEIGGEVLCPGCIYTGVTSRKWARLENRRLLYDNVSLAVAVAPGLLIWPTVITAPMAIFLALRYWKTPTSIVKRTKIRFVLAIAIALCQIGFWGFAGYLLMLTRGSVK